MTVIEAFQEFKSSLELPDRSQDQAAASQKEIREKVANYLSIPDSFLSGSYARHTKIFPLNDIDVMLVRNDQAVPLRTDGNGVLASTALDHLVAAVNSAYPYSATATKQARSVNVQIQGLSFGFDLIPAWLRHPDGYWIPDTATGGWLPSDPKAHARLMTDANERCANMLKPVIKMVKHWSRNNFDLMCSFHLELICRDVLLNNLWSNFQLGVALVLYYLKNYVGQQWMDPVYGVSRIDKQLSQDDQNRLLTRISTDASSAKEAFRLEALGYHDEAIKKWSIIFVSGFPS